VFHNNLGIALERTGHYSAAAEAYGAVLAQDSAYDKASVSLARVARFKDDPSTTPVDLSALARQFVTEMEGWYPPVAKLPPLDEEPAEIEPPQDPESRGLPESVEEASAPDSAVTATQDTATAQRDTTKVSSDTTGRGGR